MTSEEEVPRRRVSDHVEPEPHISDKSSNVASEIRRTLRILIALTVILYLILGTFVVITRIDSGKSNKALCALRKANQDQIDESVKFVAKHPEGFAGISTAEIQKSIQRSLITDKALSVLNC